METNTVVNLCVSNSVDHLYRKAKFSRSWYSLKLKMKKLISKWWAWTFYKYLWIPVPRKWICAKEQKALYLLEKFNNIQRKLILIDVSATEYYWLLGENPKMVGSRNPELGSCSQLNPIQWTFDIWWDSFTQYLIHHKHKPSLMWFVTLTTELRRFNLHES